MSPQTKYWLQTTFQNAIQVALQLSKKPALEQKPYQHKYLAIQKLKKLVSANHNYKFIPYTLLGEMYSDVQQTNDSVKSYESALIQLSKLSLNEVHLFYQYYMIVYNMLGLSLVNRQDNQGGLGCLCKSYQIYEAYAQNPGVNTYHNRSYKSKGRHFNFYYQGGSDYQQIQQNHTLTLFYLAQGYTKISLKDKAAEYCGYTLQREYASKKFEVNQFCNNLIGLSEYYSGNKYYAQAEYILLLALKVLPEGRKRKMRALIQIQIAKMISDMLQYSTQRIGQKNPIQPFQIAVVNKQILLFNQFDQKFPQIKLANDLQQCKSLFRKANTQLKKAVQVFVLDGFVTQHIQILFQQSRLYKSLSIIETSRQRVFNMLQKRRQTLQPLLKQLNPKAYPATWQKILVQVSEIYNDSFAMKHLLVLDTKGTPTQQKLQQLNNIGFRLIHCYDQIVKCLQEDKDAEKNEQYFRSLVNSKFNVCKTYSRLMSLDKAYRVKFLKTSYEKYRELYKYIEQIDVKIPGVFLKQLQLTKEMVHMVPSKIDKINYGLVSPLQ